MNDCERLREQGETYPDCCQHCHDRRRLHPMRIEGRAVRICCALATIALLRGAVAGEWADDEELPVSPRASEAR